MDAFDAGRVAPEAVDGRGVDLAVHGDAQTYTLLYPWQGTNKTGFTATPSPHPSPKGNK